MDSYISGKIVQYKEQIATLEKREERYVIGGISSVLLLYSVLAVTLLVIIEASECAYETDTRLFLQIESQCSEGHVVNFSVTRYFIFSLLLVLLYLLQS